MKAQTKQRLLKIADAIEAAPSDRFDMGTWIRRKVRGAESYTESVTAAKKLNDSCGTAGCIAGWTVGVFPRAGNPNLIEANSWRRSYSIEDHAKRILDLTDVEADSLFRSGFQMNNRQAAKRIRKAAETGVIETVGVRGGRLR